MADVAQFDLAGAGYGGLINEDVMQRIWDISNIPLPLTDRIGSDSHGNAYAEWTVDALQAPVTNNKQVDLAATSGNDDTNLGERHGNHTQTSTKTVKVGTVAMASDTIGFADALAYQVMQRQRELRRDVEAQMLTSQASVKEASGTAAVSAGLAAWVDQNEAANGTTANGFNTSTGIVAARTGASDASDVAMTEAMVRSVAKQAYIDGGEPTVFMSTPSLCEGFSSYLFTSSARVAALQSDVRQARSGVVATGAVEVFVSDFAVLEIVPNRLQQIEPSQTTTVTAFVIDPTMLRISYLRGYRTEPLAKTGLFEQRQISVSYTLKVLNEDAHGTIANIDQTGTVTA